MDILGECPRCLPVRRASFKSFLSWNDDKATAAVTEYLRKNPFRIDRNPFHSGDPNYHKLQIS